MSDHIENAVGPRKDEVVKYAEGRIRSFIAKKAAALEEANGVLDIVAPEGDMWTREHAARRTAWKRLVTIEGVWANGVWRQDARSYGRNDLPIYRMDADRCERVVTDAKENAAASFERYVAKLNMKCGEVVAAELSDGFIWNNSVLTVTKPDGEVEKWSTKMILNFSSLGTPFNQWPTRKMKPKKGGAA
tara:strand:+ start:40 stop:606 length:567 start_codon:yes stop_codon:yes gene_type:complete